MAPLYPGPPSGSKPGGAGALVDNTDHAQMAEVVPDLLHPREASQLQAFIGRTQESHGGETARQPQRDDVAADDFELGDMALPPSSHRCGRRPSVSSSAGVSIRRENSREYRRPEPAVDRDVERQEDDLRLCCSNPCAWVVSDSCALFFWIILLTIAAFVFTVGYAGWAAPRPLCKSNPKLAEIYYNAIFPTFLLAMPNFIVTGIVASCQRKGGAVLKWTLRGELDTGARRAGLLFFCFALTMLVGPWCFGLANGPMRLDCAVQLGKVATS